MRTGQLGNLLLMLAMLGVIYVGYSATLRPLLVKMRLMQPRGRVTHLRPKSSGEGEKLKAVSNGGRVSASGAQGRVIRVDFRG